MDAVLWVCAGISLAGTLLALVFLPWRIAAQKPAAQAPQPAAASSPQRHEYGVAV